MAQLLTLEQASVELQVSRDTLKRLSARGDLKTVRLGRRIMIPISEVSRITEQGAGKYASSRGTDAPQLGGRKQ